MSCSQSNYYDFYIAILVLLIIFLMLYSRATTENFDAVGMYYNIPSEWFIKKEYDLNDWLVNTYTDTIQPSCLSYDKASKYGSLENINYLASAYRFWRI